MDKLKNGKKSISSIALAYMIAAAVVSAAVIMCSYCMIHYLNIARESSSLINKFEETYKFMESKESATSDDIEDDLCMSARLAASAVRAADDDLRPAKYRSGYIIRKRGGDVEFPEDYSSDITLTLSDLPQDYSTNVIDNNVVSCAKIRGNYYYVELQEKSEEEKVIKKGVKYQDALDNIASATGFDYISVRDAENGDYTIAAATRSFAGFTKASELGLVSFLDSMIHGGDDPVTSETVNIKGRMYIALGTKKFNIKYEPDDAAVMLVPLSGAISRAVEFTFIMVFVIMIMCIPMAVWLIAIFRRITGGYFTEEQLESSRYEIVKRKVVLIVILCTIIAYIGAAFALSLDGAFQQTTRGNSTLKEFFKRIDDDADRTSVQWESSQKRYIRNAKRLASLIDNNKALQNENWLKEASGIIDADYIMIFDENGNETISDSRYKRISLNGRENPDMADFSRLLNGVESISHAGVKDEVTGLTRDYHGICLKYMTDKDTYGALLIAVDPKEHTWVSFSNTDSVAASMAPENGFIIGVDPKTGGVDVSSSKTLEDNKLKGSDIDDSFFGFLKLDRRPYFALSSDHDDEYYYYGVEEKYMLAYVLVFAIGYALLLLLILGMLCRILLKRSPYNNSEAEIIRNTTREKLDKISEFILKAAEKNIKLIRIRSDDSDDKLNIGNTRERYYRSITPEREALSTFEILLFMFTTVVSATVIIRNLSNGSGQTVLDFLLTGKWTHGLNLFSFMAIFFLFCILFVCLALLKAVSAALNTVLSKRALTVCSLIMNLLFYVALIGFVFVSLGFLGVNATALLASAGLVGLAVSMSLRDILADVMAGIMLITGRMFEVGDYIEIRDACAGTVKSMGLRRTELISNSGQSFFIRNSQINKVTNHSHLAEKKKAPDEKTNDQDVNNKGNDGEKKADR